MYIDTQGMSDEEITKMKRRIKMQQLSYDSDLKKVQRKQMELKDDLKRYEQERSRIEVYIKENEQANKKMLEKEEFILEELKRIKKQLIELG
jgi:hypothetical protein